MKLIVGKKKVQGDYLQHQEEKKIGKLSDEEKYISHKGKFEVKAQSRRMCSGIVLNFLSHNKRIPVIMFQSKPRTTNHAFQRIVCNMYRQLYFLAQAFVEPAQQCAATGEV